MANRSIYLEDIPLDEAVSLWTQRLRDCGSYTSLNGVSIPLDEAVGRVTAEPIWAAISAPHYHAAAMDGYALTAASTETATETGPLTLQVPDQALYVDTGDPLPHWANAVIPIEHVNAREETPQFIEIRASTSPWRHVRAIGEDMVATELVLPANHTLRPVDIGAIAGCGHSSLSVRRKPRVAIIPTGSELVPPTKDIRPGQIVEYNSLVLASQIQEWGGLATRWQIIPDEHDAISTAAKAAAQNHDLVLINAGSSRGSEDFTAGVVQEVGNLLVHGIAVRPGHPVILGTIDTESPDDKSARTIPVVGVPGYPVSAALTGEIFVEPLLAKWLGRPPNKPPTLTATMTRKVLSHTGDDEFMRVSVGKVGDRTVATPQVRGAGVISSLVRADGIVRIPRFSEGIQAGQPVTVHLRRNPNDISQTIVAIGSHDLTLDLLAQFLAQTGTNTRLSSSNVGSLSGLVALRREECHIAGTHLLDPSTGDYNVSYVRQYLPDTTVLLVTMVERQQGLIVAKGNPKQLNDLTDVTRENVRFVNRQRGAGTRILLDFSLKQLSVNSDDIDGYDREEYTHLSLAAAIASGLADCGLGIRAAASALGLDFLPLDTERYEIAIPHHHERSQLLRPLLELLHNDGFRSAVGSLDGYSISKMGEVRTITPSKS